MKKENTRCFQKWSLRIWIINHTFRLTRHRKSNHRKKFSPAHPIFSANEFLRIRFSNGRENKRTRKTFRIRKSIGSGTMRLLENIHRWGSVAPTSRSKEIGGERRIGSPSNDVSPAVGDRFRRRKPRTSGNLITSRRSTALIRDLSRWTGRRAAKIEPALPLLPSRREREGWGTRTGKRVKLETKTLRAGQARDPFATITFYRLSWRVNCV